MDCGDDQAPSQDGGQRRRHGDALRHLASRRDASAGAHPAQTFGPAAEEFYRGQQQDGDHHEDRRHR